MRILTFSPAALPDHSPGIGRLINTCAGVARSGGEVSLRVRRIDPGATSSFLDFYGVDGYLDGVELTVGELPGRWGWPFFASRLDRIFKPLAGKPLCVYLSEIMPWVPRLIERARAAGGRVIFEPSGPGPGAGSHPGLREEILKKVDGLVCARRQTLDSLRPDLRPNTPATVLSLGSWSAPAPSGQPRDIDVLYCGPLDPGSGIDLVVAAMQTLIPHTLTIAGPASRVDVSRLQQAALAVGAMERVKFLPDLPPSRMWDVYARAKIGVLPLPDADPERMALMDVPLQFLEMMAAGLPILANRLEVLSDYSSDGRDVMLAAGENPRQLADGLRSLLRDEPLRARLGAAARARVAEFTWDGRGARLLAFAEEILK